jgi:hypothetical protein
MPRARRATKSDERTDPNETVRYINLMTTYLRKLAADEGMEFLAYLLAMVESEAMSIHSDSDGNGADSRTA